MKIAMGNGHYPDQTWHCHPHFQACFSMVTHGNETQIGFQIPLRAMHIFIDAFMRTQGRELAVITQPRVLNFLSSIPLF